MKLINIYAVALFCFFDIYISNVLYAIMPTDRIIYEYLFAGVFGLLILTDKTFRARTDPCDWWAPGVGIGIGSGISAYMHIPQASVIHFPVFILFSLAITVIGYNMIKKHIIRHIKA